MRWPLRCLMEEPEWRMGRRCGMSVDLDSWGDASLDYWGDASLDTETLLRGRKAACNGEESRGGETGRKLWRAMSSGWEWESRGEEW